MVTRPAEAPPKGYRPHMPLKVKLEACLIELFGKDLDIEFDHEPAIALRVWDPVAKDTIPAANDPKHITPKLKKVHRAKTGTRKGNATTRGQDQAEIARTRRLATGRNALADALEGKKCGKPVKPKTKSKWPPKQKLQSRNNLRKTK